MTNLGGLPTILAVLAVVAFSSFATAMTSNTALVSPPLLAAVGSAIGVPPQLRLIRCTPAASFAFLMPVGSPPNAIVFGAGLAASPQLRKAGIVLNAAAVLLVTVFARFVIVPLLAMGRIAPKSRRCTDSGHGVAITAADSTQAVLAPCSAHAPSPAKQKGGLMQHTAVSVATTTI